MDKADRNQKRQTSQAYTSTKLKRPMVMLGLLLVMTGVIAILEHSLALPQFEWTGLLLLVPSLMLIASAVRRYLLSRSAFERDVRVPFMGGTAMLLISLMVLLQWSWSQVWPMFILWGGIALLAKSLDR